MPAYYDVPLIGALGNQNFQVEDVDKFQKLPFYLVMNEVRRFPQYKVYDSLYGSVKWQPNQGSIMRGVTPNPSPDSTSFVYPANITSTPNRNIYETLENTEEARVKLQRFESKQFYFLPSWQDFRDNQLKFNHDDVIRQVALYNEKFIQGNMWFRAPNVYVCGNNGTLAAQFGTSDFIPGVANGNLPTAAADGTITIDANSKTTDFVGSLAQICRDPLTLRHIARMCQFFADDVGALPFEGTLNVPRDNELVKGKYVLVMGTDAWRRFTWDDSVDRLKNLQLDLLFDGFRGSLFGQITTKPIWNPLRFTNEGVFVPPQYTEMDTGKTRPNPNYTKIDGNDANAANFEIAFLCGADAWKTVTVGPPPSEFSSRSMDAEKFYKLRWNGEIQLTDQVLVRYSDGTLDLNKYATNLQLYGQLALGALAGEINNVLPIIFRRSRISSSENAAA